MTIYRQPSLEAITPQPARPMPANVYVPKPLKKLKLAWPNLLTGPTFKHAHHQISKFHHWQLSRTKAGVSKQSLTYPSNCAWEASAFLV